MSDFLWQKEAVGPDQQSLLGGCWGAADQGTTGHSDALSSSGNVVTHHGWAGTKSQVAGKEGE